MLSNLQTQRTLPPNTVIKCRLLFSRRVEWMVGEFFHWDVEIWAPQAYHLHIDKRREIRLHTVVKRVCALDVVGYWGTRFTLSCSLNCSNCWVEIYKLVWNCHLSALFHAWHFLTSKTTFEHWLKVALLWLFDNTIQLNNFNKII